MKICVFGASSDLIEKQYLESAYDLGREMAKRRLGLVFGGGNCGVMGASAKGVKSGGGYVLGVAPTFMKEYNLLYDNCTEFKFTQTMAERKTFMEDNADAFIVAPGGIGTFEELFEVYTLKQLGRHSKAIAIYNVCGYYDHLQELLANSVKENFLLPQSLELIRFFDEINPMLDYIESYDGKTADTMSVRYGR
ncbi:MAG: TIGR00730 family Rossman fold protein [Clostridiales bacterium]|nr:TIGR00730 family Rossman fold protein [Clostridiales bacterium]